MKKIFTLLLLSLLLIGCANSLPKPENEEGMRGEFGIDKHINEETLDKYLNRDDVVYRDMRMLVDEANYEAIGGDRYLSGFVKGFKVIPYPYLCNVKGLPPEVGDSYTGTTLFTQNDDGTYTQNYEESMNILNEVFPKDKVIFLMCGGGGYAGMTKNMLLALGYDQNKVYNVGGFWYYEGKNKVNVKQDDGSYNFELVDYYDIDFTKLTKIK